MCNPRRVIIRLAETVREEWQRTIAASVIEQTEVHAEAVLETQVDLAAELGEVALQELRGLLAEGYGGWQADGAIYTLALENGIGLRYTPETGHLEVRARLSETVQAAAEAGGTFSGTLDAQVEVEGVGRYYDDEWGGHTEARAREAAERDAQAQLAAAREQLVSAAARLQAEEQARAEAQTRLREEAERRQAVLEERLDALLRESEEHVQAAIGALLGQTYRRAILRIVNEGGGQIIQDTEQGAIVDLVARI
jgi:bacterioferritin (cytochrome b1)